MPCWDGGRLMTTGLGFDAIIAPAAVVAGSIASIAGFGIGSILTPLIALRHGMKAAVSAVAVPHVIATSIRFWPMSTAACSPDSG